MLWLLAVILLVVLIANNIRPGGPSWGYYWPANIIVGIVFLLVLLWLLGIVGGPAPYYHHWRW